MRGLRRGCRNCDEAISRGWLCADCSRLVRWCSAIGALLGGLVAGLLERWL
jgi:hypothetical protein